jgi:hypothetical protein
MSCLSRDRCPNVQQKTVFAQICSEALIVCKQDFQTVK